MCEEHVRTRAEGAAAEGEVISHASSNSLFCPADRYTAACMAPRLQYSSSGLPLQPGRRHSYHHRKGLLTTAVEGFARSRTLGATPSGDAIYPLRFSTGILNPND